MGPRVCAGVSGERTQVIQMTQVVSPKFRVPAHATNTAAASTCRDSIIFSRTLLRERGGPSGVSVRFMQCDRCLLPQPPPGVMGPRIRGNAQAASPRRGDAVI